jgi:GNAT superfamily N-acetyltransferase
VKLRRGRPADAGAIAAVMRAAIRAVPAGAQSRAALAAWAALPPLYHRWAMGPGGERYVVATGAGGRPRLVGYAARRGAELSAVFVRPSAAGRGVGAALVAAVARAARRAGARSLRVVAAEDAVPFYGRLGFRGARRVEVPLPGGVTLAARAMSRPLGGAASGVSSGTRGRRGASRRSRARTAGRGGARSSR